MWGYPPKGQWTSGARYGMDPTSPGVRPLRGSGAPGGRKEDSSRESHDQNLEDCVCRRIKMELQGEEFPLNLHRVQAEPAPSAAGIRPFQG